MHRLANFGIGFLTLLLTGALAGSGCRSLTHPVSARFASVVIKGRTAQQIRDTAVEVFAADGYQTAVSGQTMIFQKQGTVANTVAHDGLIAAQGGAATLVRVRAGVVDLGGGAHRLECEAFMVKGAGDRFFEEEHRVSNLRRLPYQNLLNQVAHRLK